jgi:hypothetical protein
LEEAVWAEIEGLLRQPARALTQLKRRLAKEARSQAGWRGQMVRLEKELAQKGEERDRVLGLYRKGRISEGSVERQMQEIAEEEAALHTSIGELALRLEGVGTAAAQLEAAAGILEKLGTRLQETLSWELQRELIERLVEEVRVDTREQGGQRVAGITVTCRFSTGCAIQPSSGSARRFPRTPDGGPRLELRIAPRPGRRAAALMAIGETA